jgi:hypothetical protein
VASPKTAPSNEDPSRFIAAIDDPVRRRDSVALVEMMSKATGDPPTIWGTSIVGFGRYHYRYDSGREGQCLCWFRRRKLVDVLRAEVDATWLRLDEPSVRSPASMRRR